MCHTDIWEQIEEEKAAEMAWQMQVLEEELRLSKSTQGEDLPWEMILCVCGHTAWEHLTLPNREDTPCYYAFCTCKQFVRA